MENSTPHNSPQPAQTPAGEKAATRSKWKPSMKAVRTFGIILAILVVLAGLAYRYKSLVIAAMVNGRPLSRLTVIKQLEKQGGQDVLSSLIDKRLVQNEAQAKGIQVSQDDINKEIKKYEDQFNVNGHTLDETLAAQHLTREDLKEQIALRQELLKLLGDKVSVSDEEVQSYITTNKITLPQGQEDLAKSQIKEQLQQQKLSEQAGQYLDGLKAKANIKTFVNY